MSYRHFYLSFISWKRLKLESVSLYAVAPAAYDIVVKVNANLQCKNNRKIYVAYQMLSLPMTFNGFEGRFFLFTPYKILTDIARRAVPLR